MFHECIKVLSIIVVVAAVLFGSLDGAKAGLTVAFILKESFVVTVGVFLCFHELKLMLQLY